MLDNINKIVHGDRKFFASSLPGLSLSGLFPKHDLKDVFPLNKPHAEYFYNARSAIYTLAELWELKGKEVLFPSYCCGVDLNALLAAGVVPKIYQVHEGMRVDASDIRNAIGEKTRAIYLIHYLGFPGPVEELAALCREKKIYLIEDCALALFSRLNGKPLGSFGDAAVFSLYKSLPVPSGGVLVINNGKLTVFPERLSPPFISTMTHLASSIEYYINYKDVWLGQKALQLARTLGRGVKRSVKAKPVVEILTDEFDPEVAGYKMSRLSHRIAKAQDPEYIVGRRRENYQYLHELLEQHVVPVFKELPEGVCPLFYPILLPDNQAAMKSLRERGVEAWAWWSTTHPYLTERSFPDVEMLRGSVVVIPCHEGLSKKVVERVANEVVEILKCHQKK